MREHWRKPAASIIQILGGLNPVSEAAGVSVTSVQRWRLPREKGGTDGFVPRKYHSKLILAAAEKGITLPLAAFVDEAMIVDLAAK